MSDIKPKIGLELDLPEITATLQDLEKRVLGSPMLKKVEANFKKSQDFLTSYQIAQSEKRLKTVEKLTALETSANLKEAQKQKKISEQLIQAQIDLTIRGTQKKIQTLQQETRFKYDMLRREEQADRERAARLRRDIQVRLGARVQEENLVEKILRQREAAEKKHQDALRKIQEQNARVRERFNLQQLKNQEMGEAREDARRRRMAVQDARAAFGGGKESDGKKYSSWRDRNIVGGLGTLNLAAAGHIAGQAAHAFDFLRSHAAEADHAIDGIDIALAKVGDTSKKTRDQMFAAGRVIADDFAKRETEVNKLQALVAGYGGQIGETNTRIVELALANEQALGVPAENLAKMFAKATDPENEASLSRLGLVFRKGAGEAERWAAINEKFGQSVDVAKKSTRDGMGEAQRAMNKASDAIAALALRVMEALTPAFKIVGTVISDVVLPAFEFLLPVIETLSVASFGLAGVIVASWDDIKSAVGDAWDWIKDRWDDIKVLLNDITFGIAGVSRAEIDADKEREIRSEKTAASLEKFRKKEDAAQAERAAKELARQQALGDALDPNKFAQKTDEQIKQEETAAKERAAKSKQQRKELYESLVKDEDRKLDLAKATHDLTIAEEQLYWERRLALATKYQNIEAAKDAQHQLNLLGLRARPDLRAPKRTRGVDISLSSVLDKPEAPRGRGSRGLGGDKSLTEVLAEEDQKAQDQFAGWSSVLAPVNDGFSALFSNVFSGLDGVASGLRNSKDAFSNFLGAFLQGLSQMAAELAGKLALFAIFSLLTGGSGTVFNIGKGLLGFAKGGDAPLGQPSVVGEEGPEFLIPHKGGAKVIPMSAKAKRSIRMGGFINKGGGKPGQSIRQGGFINRGGAVASESIWKFDHGRKDDSQIWKWDHMRENQVAALTASRGYGGGFGGGDNTAIMQELKSLRAAYAQRQTIVVDSYSARIGQLKASRENSNIGTL